jgi:hypothetical protein
MKAIVTTKAQCCANEMQIEGELVEVIHKIAMILLLQNASDGHKINEMNIKFEDMS